MSIIITIILFVIALKKIDELRIRVSILEKEKQSSLTPVMNIEKEVMSTPSVNSIDISEDVTPPVQIPDKEDGWEVSLSAWLKEDWMLKVGAALLLGGIGWFVSYAFAQDWIGPFGRITLGYMLGIAFLIYGWYKLRDSTFRRQATVFFILGATVIMLTTYSARALYDFFTPVTAVIVLFLTSAFVAISGVRFSAPSLPVAGILMAGAAPLLSGGSESDYILLFSYLLVVVAGYSILALFSGRREIIFTGILLVSFYSAPYILSWNHLAADKNVLTSFAYLFTTVFFITTLLAVIKSYAIKTTEAVIPDSLTITGAGLFLLTWVVTVAPEEWQSIILCAWTIVFIVGAFVVARRVKSQELFYTYGLVGLLMLGVATALEWKGEALIVAFTIEAVAAVVGNQMLTKNTKQLPLFSFLFLIPVLLSIEYLMSQNDLFSKGTAVITMFAFVLFGMALYIRNSVLPTILEDGELLSSIRSLYATFLVSASIYVLVLLWQIPHSATLGLAEDGATFISLILYTIIGISVYIYGKSTLSKGAVLYGGTLIGFVVGRLLLIDIWDMNLFGRIITFAGVGILLMATAFIGRGDKKNTVTS